MDKVPKCIILSQHIGQIEPTDDVSKDLHGKWMFKMTVKAEGSDSDVTIEAPYAFETELEAMSAMKDVAKKLTNGGQ